MRNILLCLSFFAAVPAYAELASDNTVHARVHLFFSDSNGDIMRTICDVGSQVFDRNTCNSELRRAKLEKFFGAFESEYGAAVDPSTTKISGAWANIERIDARLRQLAADEPATRPSPTLEEIQAAEIVVADKHSILAEVRDQIARGEAALRIGGADPDIIAQLAVLQVKRSDLEREVVELRNNVSRMRTQYVSARVDETDVDYRDLKRLREEFVLQLEDGQRRLRDALDDRILGETILRRIREVGFTWVSVSTRQLPGVSRVSGVFTKAELASRTYALSDPGGPHTFKITTPGGELEILQCLFYLPPVVHGGSCYVHLTQADGKRSVYRAYNVSSKLSLNSSSGEFNAQLTTDGFFDTPIRPGEFRIALGCEGGWASFSPAGPSHCAITMKP